MSFGKPTPPEAEYFAREEQEKIRALRKKLDQDRADNTEQQAQKLHWMKCPKCGKNLEEQLFRDVKVDICNGCSGMWLDAGELDLLLNGSSDVIGNIVRSIRETFRTNDDPA